MKEKIVEILADYKNVSPDTIKTDVPFTELGLDSLDVAELQKRLLSRGVVLHEEDLA